MRIGTRWGPSGMSERTAVAGAAVNGRPQARILVVDDEAAITDLVGLALRYEGFEVATAATGRDALGKAAEFAPDLVVLDVMLPDRDGFEVCSRLRCAAASSVPVLFLTARDATEDKINGLTVGGDDYVTKPFSLEELVARVRAVLRRTEAGAGQTGAAGVRRPGARRGRARGPPRRRAAASCRRPSSSCCATCCSTPAGCCRRRRSSTTCGSTTSAATPTSSRRTSATCARRWTATGRR